MASGVVLAIDQGTTNTKALLVGRDGLPVFRASAPVSLLQPQPDFIEQDPSGLWQSVCEVIRQCVAFAKERAIVGGGHCHLEPTGDGSRMACRSRCSRDRQSHQLAMPALGCNL